MSTAISLIDRTSTEKAIYLRSADSIYKCYFYRAANGNVLYQSCYNGSFGQSICSFKTAVSVLDDLISRHSPLIEITAEEYFSN